MRQTFYGSELDLKTVEVRMAALAAEGLTPESFGVTEPQLRHHLDPRHADELRELIKIDPSGRERLFGIPSREPQEFQRQRA